MNSMTSFVFCLDPVRPNLMDYHLQSHISEKWFFCRYCSTEFTLPNELKAHEKEHNDRKPFHCDKCPKTYKWKFELKRHKQGHHLNDYPLKCEFCNKGFMSPAVKAKHLRTHTGERIFQCSMCPKQFALKYTLTNHISKVHLKNSTRFECKFCGKHVTSNSSLRLHISTHNTERKREFQCQLCPKKFFTIGGLRNHLHAHTGEKPFNCLTCNRRFALKSKLQSHILYRHLNVPGDKICIFCSKRFRCQSGLNQHYLGHTGEKRHICFRCGIEYATVTHLNSHMKTDCTKNKIPKPFRCNHCERSYKSKDSLNRHMRSISLQEKHHHK